MEPQIKRVLIVCAWILAGAAVLEIMARIWEPLPAAITVIVAAVVIPSAWIGISGALERHRAHPEHTD